MGRIQLLVQLPKGSAAPDADLGRFVGAFALITLERASTSGALPRV